MDPSEQFEAERPRLVRIAAGLLDDRAEAEDMVQQAWLRFDGTGAEIDSLPAWLTVVTTRLCLDRLRAKVPQPTEPMELPETQYAPDPVEQVVLADSVGVALQVVLEHLSPAERVAFVLHDTFSVDFHTIASVLDVSSMAARKLASRARSKVSAVAPRGTPADWEVVDAFLAAARGGNFARLVHLLAPDVLVTADAEAIAAGTPHRLEGRDEVAAMFDGAAKAALPVFLGDRPGAAWFNRGQARVVFDFTIANGVVQGITFRAQPEVLASLTRRDAAVRR
ncbi:sigma-70 family RNA polymerase sigma factor [Arthrobacter crusticola]|uniref:Sigma-70 family RNA polymerase sigma factor n=1 Tax=Arthrobacter crusticola TaxID=2547960 RepID=A0A4R5U2R0_9MICC|nr:sigma-70 family RNA polymerase sigma factor [Arthrobacter crusticola]TDK27960.1 sigma-70 family RNA polymerase sigma factor [Arthrobacter crusticola]